MQALYEYITDLLGVVLVFQPTDMAAADLLRTLDFLKFKKVPILGLISNMSHCYRHRGRSSGRSCPQRLIWLRFVRSLAYHCLARYPSRQIGEWLSKL